MGKLVISIKNDRPIVGKHKRFRYCRYFLQGWIHSLLLEACIEIDKNASNYDDEVLLLLFLRSHYTHEEYCAFIESLTGDDFHKRELYLVVIESLLPKLRRWKQINRLLELPD